MLLAELDRFSVCDTVPFFNRFQTVRNKERKGNEFEVLI